MSSENLAALSRASSPSPRLALANVLGVGVHAVNIESAADLIDAAIANRRKGYVCVTGVHGVMEARRCAEFRRVLASAMLVVPDGMPTVWVGRAQGHTHMQRVFGPDLMLEVCRRSLTLGYSHFLYGGKPGVAEDLALRLKTKFPGINIAGTYTPPFRPLDRLETADLQRQLLWSAPDIMWIGLSTPKQEEFMAANLAGLNCRVMVGVGAAFDLHTDRLKDSPLWMKKAGLQWAHRLYQEPSRLWKRYLINNSGFVSRLALQALRLKRYELDDVQN